MPDDHPILDLMQHQRAVRLFAPGDVDDATVERLIDAATRAPSSRNSQPCRFIAVRDHAAKDKLGQIFDELGASLLGYDPSPDDQRTAWRDVPLLIVVCTESGDADGSSVYPAVQNLLLAVQAVGLGGLITTRWKRREPEVREILGIPGEAGIHAIVPVGPVAKPPGRNRRRSVAEVSFRDRWGQGWS